MTRKATLSMWALLVFVSLTVRVTGSETVLDSGVVKFNVSDDWGSGFTAEVSLKNTGDAVDSWTLEFDFAHEITNIWNATIKEHNAGHYVIEAASWNKAVAKNATVSFGFVGKPGNVSEPTNYVFNGNGGSDPDDPTDPDDPDNPDNPDNPDTPVDPELPAKPTLSVLKDWQNGGYDVNWTKWSGVDGSSWELYENDTQVYSAELTASGGAQTGTYHVGEDKPYGVYSYKVALVNNTGKTYSDESHYSVDGASFITFPQLDSERQLLQITLSQNTPAEIELKCLKAETPNYTLSTNNSSVFEYSLTNSGKIRLNGLKAGRASLKIEEESTGEVRYVGIRVRNADGSLPGMPDHLALGSVSEDTDADLKFWRGFSDGLTNRRMDARYIYINGGPKNQGVGWRTWGSRDGFRVTSYIRESLKLGMIPFLVYYNIPDGGESYTTDKEHIQNASYMTGYFEDLKYALELAKAEAGDEMVGFVLEPDFIGYMAQNNENPATLTARTDAAYMAGALVSGVDPVFSNTMRGLVEAINYTIKKHLPQAYFGWQFNLWATPAGGFTTPIPGTGICHLTDSMGIEPGRTAIAKEASAITDYYIQSGVLTHGASFVSIDKYGLDAGAEGKNDNPANSTWFWNAVHWTNYLVFVERMADRTGLPVVLWQLPVGHINKSKASNPYSDDGTFAELTNTSKNYEDSAPVFFFGDQFDVSGERLAHFSTTDGVKTDVVVNANSVTWGSHMKLARAAGVNAILFGAGVGDSTDGVGSPPTDDYWWITKAQEYLLDPVALDNNDEPENRAPVALDDSVETNQEQTATINVLANDYDLDGDVLILTSVTEPANGATRIADGKIVYTPVGGFYGSDSFKYTISDGTSTDIATCDVTVKQNSDDPDDPDDPVDPVDDSIIEFKVLNDWGSGFTGEITVTNMDSRTTTGWQLEFDFAYTITSLWNAEKVGYADGRYTFKNASWNGVLSANGTATFGFNASPGNVDKNPSNVTFTASFAGNDPVIPGDDDDDDPDDPVIPGDDDDDDDDVVVTTDRVVVGYWHNWDSSQAPFLKLSDVPSEYNVVQIAFATPVSSDNMTLTFTPNYSELEFMADVDAFQANGGKVLISIGGANHPVELDTSTDKEDFVASLIDIIERYGFDGFDIDFEGSSVILDSGDTDFANPTTPKIVNLIDAINEIRDYFVDRDLWVTLAPETQYLQGGYNAYGNAFGGYLPIIHALRDRITFVQPQLYNTGSQFGIDDQIYEQSTRDFIVAMTEALLAGFAVGRDSTRTFPPLRQDQVVFGLPATSSAAPAGGYLAPEKVVNALDYLMKGESFGGNYLLSKASGYSGLRGIMTWSINWDQTQNYEFGKTYAEYFAGFDGDDDEVVVNEPPTISFSSPLDGNVIEQTSLSTVEIRTTASDSDGTIASVSIQVDGQTFDGESAGWTPSAYGAYDITASATDDDGDSTSASITVKISNPNSNMARKQVIGYFTQWDAWKGVNHGYPAQGVTNQLNVPYDKYTIINFSFFGVAKDGSLHSGDYRNKQIYLEGEVQEPAPMLHGDIYSSWDYWLLYGELELLWTINDKAKEAGFVMEDGNSWRNTITGLSGQMPIPLPKEGGAPGLIEACHQNGVKLMASIGGWSMCKHFPEMAANSAMKANFLDDCARLIAMGFDGIDIDWEYPGPFAGMNFTGSQDDFHNFTLLMRDIRDVIGSDKLLTAAFSTAPAKLAGFEWDELDKTMDYFNIMSYDMSGGWADRTGHNSPLYAPSGELSWNNTYQYLVGLGVNPEKINMGMAFYGRGVVTAGTAGLNSVTVKTPLTVNPDGPIVTAADFTNWSAYDGAPNYDYIMKNSSGWTYHWDSLARVPYMTKDNYFLSFDDDRSIGEKANFVVNNNLGGVIIWHVFGDWNVGPVSETYGNKLPKASYVDTPLLDVIDGALNP